MSTHTSHFGGQRRIQGLIRLVRLLALVGGAAQLLLPLLFWSQPEWVARVARQEWGSSAANLQLDGGSRLAGLAASALPALVGAWAMWQVWCLFGCYARSELLALAPVRHLHRLGLALVGLALAMPLGQTLALLALTLGNPPGERQLALTLSSEHYLCLLFGLMLLAIAAVMREAVRVADENAEFI
ncbi:DUF2975 domain-containing protein [Paucibacter sp. PLA-PC-4]|uniref:DUF2975 domain-containing protein n=1 Tax=Paucibacter sp. PLA-PC-4 TaxID=2993655 RepID=UPI002249947B|nr:DUF2975 domain-containing protein [Paucibacter sp. PLA-PC-4]MCX2861059.1 DUF2975 domain-containing protein [Paucibacter sp. PLA-PC-4]